MRHANLNKLCTLAGGFSGSNVGRRATIPGTYWTAKIGRRYRTPGNAVGDVTVIELPRDAPSQESRASILYHWIFEVSYEEEVEF